MNIHADVTDASLSLTHMLNILPLMIIWLCAYVSSLFQFPIKYPLSLCLSVSRLSQSLYTKYAHTRFKSIFFYFRIRIRILNNREYNMRLYVMCGEYQTNFFSLSLFLYTRSSIFVCLC